MQTLSFNRAGFAGRSSGSIRFAGIQRGLDFGTGEIGGAWDDTAGLVFGQNRGAIVQRAANTTDTTREIDQFFAGAYIAATRGNFGASCSCRASPCNAVLDRLRRTERNRVATAH